jgi:hypothetical protein
MVDLARLYSFSDWQTHHPSEPPPGDRLDAQFENHRSIIERLEAQMREIPALADFPNAIRAMSTSLVDQIVANFMVEAAGALQSAAGSAQSAAASAGTASTARQEAQKAATAAVLVKNALLEAEPALFSRLSTTQKRAEELQARIDARWIDVTNDAKDAEGWGNYAYSWAQVSWRWAEYMDGPIPSDILAIMGISGAHWSSAFWASRAAQSAEDVISAGTDAIDSAADAAASATAAAASAASATTTYHLFQGTYYGSYASAPALDPLGAAVGAGDLFFNTTTHQLMVWDGSAWAAVTVSSGSGGPASAVSFTPTGGIASTNVQAALAEVDSEKLADAASDGNTYGRKNGSWFALPAGGGLADAPNDGTFYGRKSAAWVHVGAPDISWTPTVGSTTPTTVSAELDAQRTKDSSQDTTIAAKADSSTVTSGLALKANLAGGAAFTGAVSFGTRPTFNGQTPWDDANLVIGTSGNTVPKLNTANTWSLQQTFTIRPIFNGNTPWDSGNFTPSTVATTGAYADLTGKPTLGTAAAQNTGTSGANVPLLNGANTWSAQQTQNVRPIFNGNTPWDSGNLVTPLKADTTNQSVTGGARITTFDAGTKSSGTFTPDPGNGPHQKYTNNGAHTLAPDTTNTGDYFMDITNGASAGTITTSGWTKVSGDAFNTTNGNKFRCSCSVNSVGSLLVVSALQ